MKNRNVLADSEAARLTQVWLGLLVLVTALLLGGCANPALRDAQTLTQSGQHEAALQRLQTAATAAPADMNVRAAYLKQRDTTVAHLIYVAESTRAAGREAELESVLARLEAAAPGHPRAAWLREEIRRTERQQRRVAEARSAIDKKEWALAEAALRAVIAESPGHTDARSMLATLDEQRAEQTRVQANRQLASSAKPITLEFREATLRSVFEALARAANINFVFDKDVRGDARISLFLRNVSVEEALRVILNTQQLGSKLLNDNTLLLFPNNSQKQRDLLDTVTRSFYLINADPKQAQALIRTVAKTRDIFVDERLNLLVVRDTPEVVRLIERLVAGLDLPDPEVMLEVEVMDVSSKKLTELGISWPTTVSYGNPNGGTTLSSTDGLRGWTVNPLAIATLRGTTDITNLLANPKIRARNREKAKILLGEKLPVFTTTSTANVGVSASVSYLDVGLKVELEPQVQLDNDVTLKVMLEVSSVTGKVAGPEGSLAYQVGTRQASTSLRLRDGETQILAGLINDEDSKNAAGLPWVHNMPVLGRLFGKTVDSRNKTEVVMLVTPRVVRNLNHATLPVLPMASGTESQPGAPAWTLTKGTVTNVAGQGQGGASGASISTRPTAKERVDEPRLSGPEEVVPGAIFQITVTNPTSSPLNTAITFDPSALTAGQTAQAQGGRVAVDVPPQGSHVITFTAKTDLSSMETRVALEMPAGVEWPLRIRATQDQAQGGDAAE